MRNKHQILRERELEVDDKDFKRIKFNSIKQRLRINNAYEKFYRFFIKKKGRNR